MVPVIIAVYYAILKKNPVGAAFWCALALLSVHLVTGAAVQAGMAENGILLPSRAVIFEYFKNINLLPSARSAVENVGFTGFLSEFGIFYFLLLIIIITLLVFLKNNQPAVLKKSVKAVSNTVIITFLILIAFASDTDYSHAAFLLMLSLGILGSGISGGKAVAGHGGFCL